MSIKSRLAALEKKFKTVTKQPVRTLEDFYKDVKAGSTGLNKYYDEEVKL